jgi:hypothetical protein
MRGSPISEQLGFERPQDESPGPFLFRPSTLNLSSRILIKAPVVGLVPI